MPDEDLDV